MPAEHSASHLEKHWPEEWVDQSRRKCRLFQERNLTTWKFVYSRNYLNVATSRAAALACWWLARTWQEA